MSEMTELKFSLPRIASCPACGAEYVTALTCRVCGALLVKADLGQGGEGLGKTESDLGLTEFEHTADGSDATPMNNMTSGQPQAGESRLELSETTSEFLSFLNTLVSDLPVPPEAMTQETAPSEARQANTPMLAEPPGPEEASMVEAAPLSVDDLQTPVEAEAPARSGTDPSGRLPSATLEFLDFLDTLVSELPAAETVKPADTQAPAPVPQKPIEALHKPDKVPEQKTAAAPKPVETAKTTVNKPSTKTLAETPAPFQTGLTSLSAASTRLAELANALTAKPAREKKLTAPAADVSSQKTDIRADTALEKPFTPGSKATDRPQPVERKPSDQTNLKATPPPTKTDKAQTSAEPKTPPAKQAVIEKPAETAILRETGAGSPKDSRQATDSGVDTVIDPLLMVIATQSMPPVHPTSIEINLYPSEAKTGEQPEKISVDQPAPVQPDAGHEETGPAANAEALIPPADTVPIVEKTETFDQTANEQPAATPVATIEESVSVLETGPDEQFIELVDSGTLETQQAQSAEDAAPPTPIAEHVIERDLDSAVTVVPEEFADADADSLIDMNDYTVAEGEMDEEMLKATLTEALPEFIAETSPMFLATPPEALSRFFDDLDATELQAAVTDPLPEETSDKAALPPAEKLAPVELDSGELPVELSKRYRLLTPRIAISAKADLKRIQRVEDEAEFTLKHYRRGFEIDYRITQLLDRIRRPQVMSALERGVDKGRAWEIMEYCPLGNLRNLLNEGPLPPAICRQLVKEIALGLAALHRRKMAHRNLIPENILIRQYEPLRLTLIDVDIASRQATTQAFSCIGRSLHYTPPECISGHITPRADWWALGMIVLEASLGYHPFSDWDAQRITQELNARSIDTTIIIDRELRKLCRGLLHRDVSRAWGIDEVGRWLKRDPVATGAHPESRAIRPYTIGNRQCRTAQEVAAALLENWEQAINDWKEGVVLTWLENQLGDQTLLQSARRLQAESAGKESENRIERDLLTFIHTCNPELKLFWKGRALSHQSLLTIAGSGAVEDQLWLLSLYREKILELVDEPNQEADGKTLTLQARWAAAVSRVHDIWENTYTVAQKTLNQRLLSVRPSFRPVAITPLNEAKLCAICLLALCSQKWVDDQRSAIVATQTSEEDCPWLAKLKKAEKLDAATVVAIYLLRDPVEKYIEQAREIRAIESTRQAYEVACEKFKREREAFLTSKFPRYNNPHDTANTNGLTMRLVNICDEVGNLETHVGDGVRADWHDRVAELMTQLTAFQKRLNRCGPLEHLNVGFGDMWTLFFLPAIVLRIDDWLRWLIVAGAFAPLLIAIATYTFLFVTNPLRRRRAKALYRKVRQMAAKTREYDELLTK